MLTLPLSALTVVHIKNKSNPSKTQAFLSNFCQKFLLYFFLYLLLVFIFLMIKTSYYFNNYLFSYYKMACDTS